MTQPIGYTGYRINDIIALKQYERGEFTIDFVEGKIYNRDGKEIIGYPSKRGYLEIRLKEDGSVYRLQKHRLIYVCHEGLANLQIGKQMEVDHIDGNKLNNKISNLRMVTQSENMRNPNTLKHGEDASRAKLKNETAEEIRAMFLEGGFTCSRLASLFNISIDTSWRIISNISYPSTTMVATEAAKALKGKKNRQIVYSGSSVIIEGGE